MTLHTLSVLSGCSHFHKIENEMYTVKMSMRTNRKMIIAYVRNVAVEKLDA